MGVFLAGAQPPDHPGAARPRAAVRERLQSEGRSLLVVVLPLTSPNSELVSGADDCETRAGSGSKGAWAHRCDSSSLMRLPFYLVQAESITKQGQDLASQAHGRIDVSPGLISELTRRSRSSKNSPARWRPRELPRWLEKAFAREAGSFTILPVSGISSRSSRRLRKGSQQVDSLPEDS